MDQIGGRLPGKGPRATVPAGMASPDVDRPPHLLDSRSLWGAVWVLVVALFFAAGLPILADVARQSGLDAGQPYRIGDATILPVEGWSLSENSNEFFTVLEKSGASMTLIAPVESEMDAAMAIGNTVTALENDATTSWVIEDPATFTTDAGDPGQSVIARSPTDVSSSWVVDFDGGVQMSMIGQSPDNVWTEVGPEMEAMARSVVLEPEDAG